MKLSEAKSVLGSLGMSMRKTAYREYRVNFRNGTEDTAYYANDIGDAVATGRAMAERGASAPMRESDVDAMIRQMEVVL